MSAPQRLSDLSPPAQAALRIAATHGIPTDNPRASGVQRRTAEVLERDGLLVARRTKKQRRRMWRPTDFGQSLLHPPRLLSPGGRAGEIENEEPGDRRGYTSDPGRAMPDEPEAVDEATLAIARRAAHAREHAHVDRELERRKRLSLLDRLRQIELDAQQRSFPLGDDPVWRLIVRKLPELEQRVLRPADRYADAEPSD